MENKAMTNGRRLAALVCCALAMVLLASSAYGQQGGFTATVQTNLGCINDAGSGKFVVISWTVGVQNPGTRAVVGPLQLIKNFDACTPKLFDKAAMGDRIAEVTLTETDSGGTPRVTLKLTQAVVISDEFGDTQQTLGPVETVSLSYGTITITARGPHGITTFCFDQRSNSPC